MSRHFLDTSGLVKHYHTEVGSPKVDALWASPGAQLLISRLAVVEAVSVFAKKVRTGLIAAADFGLLRRRFFADLRHRRPATAGPPPCGSSHATSRKRIGSSSATA